MKASPHPTEKVAEWKPNRRERRARKTKRRREGRKFVKAELARTTKMIAQLNDVERIANGEEKKR